MNGRGKNFDPCRVLDVARESYVVMTPDLDDLRIVWVSPTFSSLTGYSFDEALGKPPSLIEGPRTDLSVVARVLASVRSGTRFEGETWHYRKNGESFLMRWYVVPLCDPDDQTTHLVAVQRDVTVDRVTEREDQQMRSSFVPHDMAVVVLDRKLRIAIANPAAEMMAGPSVGEPFFDTELAPPDGATRDELMRAIVTNRSHTVEYMLEVNGRDPIIVAVSCSPVEQADERYRTSIVINDVTDSRRIERIAANVSLADNIGHAFAGIRHELGNPVNSLKSALTFVRSQLATIPPNQLATYLDAMSQQCDRMDYLLRSLRSFSALDSVELDSIEVRPFLERFERSAADVAERRGIRFTRTIDPRCVTVYADARALFQVLLNLITNAVDACSSTADPSVTLSVRREASEIVFEVHDNGIGIAPDAIEKLFRPFYTTKNAGTGLGLAMSERLVSRMFGSLGVSSIQGSGSTFTVTLRAEAPSAIARRQAVAPSWHP